MACITFGDCSCSSNHGIPPGQEAGYYYFGYRIHNGAVEYFNASVFAVISDEVTIAKANSLPYGGNYQLGYHVGFFALLSITHNPHFVYTDIPAQVGGTPSFGVPQPYSAYEGGYIYWRIRV